MTHLRNHKKRGVSTMEVMTAASVSTVVIGALILALLAGAGSWARGQVTIDAQMSSQEAVRTISENLREAMSVSVDADGQGLSYQLPAVGSNGSYKVPAVWDGVSRSIRLDKNTGKIMLTNGKSSRVICSNYYQYDPYINTDTATYRIFTPGASAVTHQITIEIVAKTSTSTSDIHTSKSREIIYLRNVPPSNN